MKKLLIQSDDYGFTYGISDGTLRAIRSGIIKNTGLFTNMPASEYAAKKALEVEVCLGIDINLAAGRPISDPKLIPHLLNQEGYFRSSADIKKKYRLLKQEGYVSTFEIDPYPYEECLIETEAQVKRFIELTGRRPAYLNAHSIMTENTEKAESLIRQKYNIKGHSSDLYYNHILNHDISRTYVYGNPLSQLEHQDTKDYLLKEAFPSMKENELYFMIFHCGYVDEPLFSFSSLTLERMHDTSVCTNPEVIKYIQDNNIQLITYDDLYKPYINEENTNEKKLPIRL